MVLRVEREGATWILTIDRPETRNAVDEDVHDALSEALDDVEASDARAVILSGAGDAFVSGGDLKLIRDRPFEETLGLSQRMTALLDRVESLPFPVIAAINGYAFGGGCEVMLACDYRVAAGGAKVSFRQAAMGLTTGWGATTRLSQVVSRSVAARLLFAAEVLDATEAARVGLVDEVVDDALARARELAARIARQSPAAVASFKRILSIAYGADARSSRAAEWTAFQELWGGPDHEAALAAFFAGRDAKG